MWATFGASSSVVELRFRCRRRRSRSCSSSSSKVLCLAKLDSADQFFLLIDIVTGELRPASSTLLLLLFLLLFGSKHLLQLSTLCLPSPAPGSLLLAPAQCPGESHGPLSHPPRAQTPPLADTKDSGARVTPPQAEGRWAPPTRGSCPGPLAPVSGGSQAGTVRIDAGDRAGAGWPPRAREGDFLLRTSRTSWGSELPPPAGGAG